MRRATPKYSVMLHHGEPSGSAAGHFDATTRVTGGLPTCPICMDVLMGEPGQRGDDRWGYALCCRATFHFGCLSTVGSSAHMSALDLGFCYVHLALAGQQARVGPGGDRWSEPRVAQ